MPIVFVHGVNVRYDPQSDPYVKARSALFRRYALQSNTPDGPKPLVLNPYWGEFAAHFPWGFGGLPAGSFESFGDAPAIDGILDLHPSLASLIDRPERALVDVAQNSLETAIDALWRAAAIDLDDTAIAAFVDVTERIGAYVDANPRPAWLDGLADDRDLLERLIEEASRFNSNGDSAGTRSRPAIEMFGADGFSDRLRTAFSRMQDGLFRAADGIRRAATGARRPADVMFLRARTPFHKLLVTFLGDVFVYFRQREARSSPIADVVSRDLLAGAAERDATGEALIVVAHSMGGIIVYDLLTSALSDLHVDTLVTAGSQIAVIEELKLFTSSDRTIPNSSQKKVSKPANVGRWLNVFDTTDILGFAAERVFEDVNDHVFATGHAWAHGGYFVEPSFHRRLGARLA
jgi:hypothetical protein